MEQGLELLRGCPKHYSWGSENRIPEFLGREPDGQRVAELWFGAHPLGSATLASGQPLNQLIADHPKEALGHSTIFAFGNQLPYMMKLIAPEAPLSLQVHPDKGGAQYGFLAENARGLAVDDFARIYKDPNHKPELVLALTKFEALVGFAVRTQIQKRLEGLDCSLASKLSLRLTLAARRSVKPVVNWILDPADGPTPKALAEFRDACQARLDANDSPCPELDRTIVHLYDAYPGDPGVLFAFTMNHVVLQAGEAIYVAPGIVHSYQHGFGLEVMANSDNVVRAGFTSKHIDGGEWLEVARFEPQPPMRIAPEHPAPGIDRFWVPVEDFVLSVYRLETGMTMPLSTAGPRISMCVSGQVHLQTKDQSLVLQKGQTAFIADREGQAVATGVGTLVQCSVP